MVLQGCCDNAISQEPLQPYIGQNFAGKANYGCRTIGRVCPPLATYYKLTVPSNRSKRVELCGEGYIFVLQFHHPTWGGGKE